MMKTQRFTYDPREKAREISEMNDPNARRRALASVPRVYQGQVNDMVGMLFRARIK